MNPFQSKDMPCIGTITSNLRLLDGNMIRRHNSFFTFVIDLTMEQNYHEHLK